MEAEFPGTSLCQRSPCSLLFLPSFYFSLLLSLHAAPSQPALRKEKNIYKNRKGYLQL